MTKTMTIANDIDLSTITPEYLKEHGLVFMDYYRMRVLATRQQVIDFCKEGMWYTEGCQRDRLMDILCCAEAGMLMCSDWGWHSTEDPYSERELMTWEVFQEDF